jgi:hypothetical protein
VLTCSSIFPILTCRSFKISGLILNWYLYKVKDMDLVLVFCMQISSFPSNICWKGCLFTIVCFGLLCQKWGGCSCMDLCLGLLLCSIGLCDCFCAGTMMFLLLWLCSTDLKIFFSFIHMCMHCFRHFYPQAPILPLPPKSSSLPGNNNRDSVFASWDKDSYTEWFLALLPCTSVLQPELIHLYLIFSLLPGHLPILTSVALTLLY